MRIAKSEPIALYYDDLTLDELRLLQAAEVAAVPLCPIECKTRILAISDTARLSSQIEKMGLAQAINRCRLGQRRKDISRLFGDRQQIINSFATETVCQDKLYFYQQVASKSLPIPKTIGVLYSREDAAAVNGHSEQLEPSLIPMAKEILRELRVSSGRMVAFKVRLGTRGQGFVAFKTLGQLLRILAQRIRRTPGNPLGYLLQQVYDKPVDYRLVYRWNSKGEKICSACLMRCSASDEEPLTSTALGRPSVGIPLSDIAELTDLGYRAVDAIARKGEPGLAGIDILPYVEDKSVRGRAYGLAKQLLPYYRKINAARRKIEREKHQKTTRSLEQFDKEVSPIFEAMHKSRAYEDLQTLGVDLSKANTKLLLDANTCVDFAQNTFYNCGLNLLQEYIEAFQ